MLVMLVREVSSGNWSWNTCREERDEGEGERGHMRLARRGGHGLNELNALACLRSEKKLSVYTS